MKNLDLANLNRLYTDSEHVDKEIFKEQRSNVLLVAGEHYTKNSNKYFARLRETNRLTERQKLRLTKNYIHRIVRMYRNQILSKAPGVTILPNNETERQDQKTAELNKKVWEHIKNVHDIPQKVHRWVDEFIGIGEVAVKIFWDPNKGELVGYEPRLDTDGSEMKDEYGQPIADEEKAIFTGDLCFEPVYGFNLMRSTVAKSMDESNYLTIRKMVDTRNLLKTYQDDPEKSKAIIDSQDKTYIVFDTNQVNYSRTEKQTLLKETYFKPSKDCPEGYYYIYTDEGILEQGPLPFGIFPICWQGFDEYPTSPRAKSILKVARPFQAEINRSASAQATHQITTGDDKVLYQSGIKLAPGALLPGVRGISYQGAPPTILPGRTGDQYEAYRKDQTRELFQAVMLDEVNQDTNNNLDPYTLLFQTAKQQSVFGGYVTKFEKFLSDVCELCLRYEREYREDWELAEILGNNELDNIAEFRRAGKLMYQIKVEPQSDNINSQLGKQLQFNHLLQYVGNNLSRDDIGKIMRHMPFVNNEEIFSEMTIDYDNVKNDMLAIERGEMPQISQYANNEYYVQKLTHRIKQADFKYLDPQVQQMYQAFLQQHEQMIAMKQQQIQDAKNDFIPVGGAMITTSMHVSKEGDPEKTKQVRVPYQALDWLVKHLEKQGMSLDKLEDMNTGALADMASMLSPEPAPMDPLPQQMPGVPGY